MNRRSVVALGIACAAMLTLSACMSPVQMMGDYPSYTERSLVAESTLIVEGVAIASESTVITPRFEGDTPEENPILGLSEEEQREAMEDADGVPARAVTVAVEVVHQGDVTPGEEITIVQTGGTVGGVSYSVDNEPPLSVGDSYLLFATDGFDGTFVILGGSAGMYVASDDDAYTPVNADVAPFSRLTPADLGRLLG